MTRPLRIAIAGLGTVGGGVVKASGRARRRACGARRPARSNASLVSARDRTKKRGRRCLGESPGPTMSLALARSDADVVVELIGGEDGHRARAGRSRARSRQACRDRQQGAAGQSRRRAGRCSPKRSGVALAFRSGGRRRHSRSCSALRESLIAYDVDAVTRHPQRHLQLHPHADGSVRARPFAEVLERSAGAGLCRSRSHARCRRRRHRAQAGAACEPCVRHHARSREHDDRGHRAYHAGGHRFRARVRLPHQTARHRAARRAHGIDQRVQPAMVRLGTPLADVDGASNGVVADAGEAGPFFFEGRGAGEAPTASAVVADLVDIARGSASDPVFGRPARNLRPAQALRPADAAALGLLSALRGAGCAGCSGRNRRPAGRRPGFPSKA